MPISATLFTQRFILPVLMPAEYGAIMSDFRCRVSPSAIWLRQVLPVHKTDIQFFSSHFL